MSWYTVTQVRVSGGHKGQQGTAVTQCGTRTSTPFPLTYIGPEINRIRINPD